jgi:hypothetical protein
MKCVDVRRALLEAEPRALEGRGDEPLARHLRECSSCSRVARAIIEGEVALGQFLESAAPRPDPERILGAAGKAGASEIPRDAPRWRSWTQAGGGLAFLPLAAAAAATALFLGRPPSLPGPPYAPPASSAGLDVQAPEGSRVAVLETNNPDITILWLFDGGS